MTMRIDVTPVRRYAVNADAPVTVTPVLAPDADAITLDNQTDLLRVSAPISYDVDIVDDTAALLKIGQLKFSVHNPDGRWTPFAGHFSVSDRDHRVRVYYARDDAPDRLLWQGFVRKIEERVGLVTDITANHELDRLEDAEVPAREIAADPNNVANLPPIRGGANAGAHHLGEVWRHIRRVSGVALPDWPLADQNAIVVLPDNATDARRFVGALLAARRRVLVHDRAGALTLRAFGPDVAAGIRHRWTHEPPTVSIRPLDVKDRLHTAIRFKARGPWTGGSPLDTTPPDADRFPDVGPLEVGPDFVYLGDQFRISTWPADHRLRFGYRELKQNFEHLFYADAYDAAARVLLDCGYPTRRMIIERDLDDADVQIGDIVDLHVADPGNFPLPFGGLYWLTGYSVNVGRETVKAAINELTPAQYAAVGARA